ncbi:unnamed protein product [Didymodactylos carnosus]|uniref:Uncharacterized protein n=1 Tax=Didymodactylos carnosus TaxID=1234261 RepID=A0A8S2CZZ8_9BILA|nr:unnamed protein product [Didymodactylos carnosus]CAF3563334.1 unnamed protein product [Didymodactylos carnosus]
MPHPYVHVEKPRQLHNRPEAPPQAIENDKKKCRQYCHTTRKASYNQELKTFIDVYKIENLQDNLILINDCSTQNELRRALQAASIASQFSIDTESYHSSSTSITTPSLIQVQSIIDNQPSIYLLFETCYLPSIDSQQEAWSSITTIWRKILTSGKVILGWGSLDDELSKFLRYGLFDQKMIPTSPRIMVNTQEWFGYWMLDREPPVKDRFPREESREEEDDYFELQIHAPKKKKKKNNGNGNIAQEWSLQRAAAKILNLFVDKSFTVSKWHCGLDQRLKTYKDTSLYGRELERNSDTQLQRRDNMINYAAIDVDVVYRLSERMKQPREQPSSPQPNHHQSPLSPPSPHLSSRIVSVESHPPTVVQPKRKRLKHSQMPLEQRKIKNQKHNKHRRANRFTIRKTVLLDHRYSIQQIKEHLNWNLIGFRHVSINFRKRLIIGFTDEEQQRRFEQSMGDDYFETLRA